MDDDGTTTTKDSDSTKLTGGDNKDSLLDPERPSSSGKSSSENASGGNDKTESENDATTVSESSYKSEVLPGKGSDLDVSVAQQDALSATPELANTSDPKMNKNDAQVSASVSCDPADSSSPEAAGKAQGTGVQTGDAGELDIESEKKITKRKPRSQLVMLLLWKPKKIALPLPELKAIKRNHALTMLPQTSPPPLLLLPLPIPPPPPIIHHPKRLTLTTPPTMLTQTHI